MSDKRDHAKVEDLRREILRLMTEKMNEGTDPEVVATAAVAAGATIYGVLMGGVKAGREEEAKALFGGWIVDNIIEMNRHDDSWPSEVERPRGITSAGMKFLRKRGQ